MNHNEPLACRTHQIKRLYGLFVLAADVAGESSPNNPNVIVALKAFLADLEEAAPQVAAGTPINKAIFTKTVTERIYELDPTVKDSDCELHPKLYQEPATADPSELTNSALKKLEDTLMKELMSMTGGVTH